MLKVAFNAKGSRLIIVALQVGAVKIYAATLEALKKKERQGETQFTTKTEVHAPLNANVFYFFDLTLFMIKFRALVLFSLLYR
jgi:hypothetical protein